MEKSIKKIKKEFCQLLQKISSKEMPDKEFSGIGLVLYDSEFPFNKLCSNLRFSVEIPDGLMLNDKKTVDFLTEISFSSHPYHDGFCFFNENGRLTHIAQYFDISAISDIEPNQLYGTRHFSAKCGSCIQGVIGIGIVHTNLISFYFEKGCEQKLTDQWDNIYKEGKLKYEYYDITKPHENMYNVMRLFEKENVKNILDLGCGAGRNLLLLAKGNFNVYGIDISKQGIAAAKKALKQNNVDACLKVGNVFDILPYKDNSFDAIVCVQVLQHAFEKEIKNAISEIKRILKPNGLLFITLCGKYSNKKMRYCIVKTAKKVAARTYIPVIGKETGVPHFIYNKKILMEHYSGFKAITFWKDEKDYYCFLGKNKKR